MEAQSTLVYRLLLCSVLGLGAASFGLAGCQRASAPPPKPLPAATPASPPASPPPPALPASVAPAAVPQIAAPSPPAVLTPAAKGPLTYGDLKNFSVGELAQRPNRFDGDGHFVAFADDEPGVSLLESSDKCQVWDARSGERLASHPLAFCTSLTPGHFVGSESYADILSQQVQPSSDRSAGTRKSADGTRLLQWQGATLSIRRADSAAEVMRYAPTCPPPGCPPIAAVAFAPDGKRLALTHAGESRILVLDTQDGHVAATLPMGPDDVVIGEMLGFGPTGVAALAGLRLNVGTSDEADQARIAARHQQQHELLQLYLFPNTAAPPRLIKVERVLDNDATRVGFILDPYARYLFFVSSGDGGDRSLKSLNLASLAEGPFEFKGSVDDMGHVSHGDCCSEMLESHWIPGSFPVLETLEEHQAPDDAKRYRASRLFTGPGVRGLRFATVDLPTAPPDPCRRRVVKPDGRTITLAPASEKYDSCQSHARDPSGRFASDGPQSLTRVADGVSMTLQEDGCVVVAGQLFSCLADSRANTYFYGEDPAQLVTLRGDQLLSLIYRPTLAADFFAGRPLPLPAADTRLGVPPELTVLSATPRRQPPALLLELKVTPPSPEPMTVRTFAGDSELGIPKPLVAGVPQTLTLDLPSTLCGDVKIYACDAQTHLCSLPAEAHFCSKELPPP